MCSQYSGLPESARSVVAVSIAALITAAALFGSLVPGAGTLPIPPPVAGVEPPAAEGITVEGPPAGGLAPR